MITNERLMLIYRVMNVRLEALLLKHEPDIFPAWKAKMEAAGNLSETNPHRGMLLAYVAVVLPLVRAEHALSADTEALLAERQTERNKNLLISLVYRGCKKRGEF